jgi:catechol 2,3-dioxygenase-like lactoylglutathione lyase family enzyme
MNLECLDHVGLPVSDVAQSVRWYQDVLGLERIFEDAWQDYPAVLAAGGTGTGVALFPSEGAPIEPSGVHSIPHVSFRASRVGYEDAKKDLQAWGVEFTESDHKIAWSIYFLDPDKHLIEITTYEAAPLSA